MRTELEGQRQEFIKQLEDHARCRRRVERQLAVLVLGRTITASDPPGVDENGTDMARSGKTTSGPPWWCPGKASHDRVMDLVYEWWLARNSLLAAEEQLNIAMGWDRFTDLAVRDERTEAPNEPRSRRRQQLSKRKLARSAAAEHDRAGAG